MSRSLKYDSNFFFDHRHIYIYIYIYGHTTTDHFTPLALRVRGKRVRGNDSFGKGFHVLKHHVLNLLMSGRCPRTALQLQLKFHSLFLQNSFDFQKSATFKALKSSPRMYTVVSFNPENGAFSRMEKQSE